MNTTHKKTIVSLLAVTVLFIALPVSAQTLEDVSAAADIQAGLDGSTSGVMKIKNKAMDDLKKIPGVKVDDEGKGHVEKEFKAEVKVAQGKSSLSASTSVQFEVKTKDRANKELDRRIKGLTDLKEKISDMKRITDAQKASIAAGIDNQISLLNALKAKIAADSDQATLKADIKSISESYRIYALIRPQLEILAAADRVAFVADTLASLANKLQTHITSLKNSGSDVTALDASLKDMIAKTADAKVQVNAAVAIVGSLTPDNGDKTKMASNIQALKDARAKVKSGNLDVVAARKDAQSIVKLFKGLRIKTDVVATSTVSTQGTTTTATTTVNASTTISH